MATAAFVNVVRMEDWVLFPPAIMWRFSPLSSSPTRFLALMLVAAVGLETLLEGFCNRPSLRRPHAGMPVVQPTYAVQRHCSHSVPSLFQVPVSRHLIVLENHTWARSKTALSLIETIQQLLLTAISPLSLGVLHVIRSC